MIKEKLEENMYVRTKHGYIAKMKGWKNSEIFGTKMCVIEYYHDNIELEYPKEITKASYNIVGCIKKKDLILAMDGKIYEVAKIWKDYVFTTTKTKEGLTKTLVDYQIDKILTKEQFESASYKRGD